MILDKTVKVKTASRSIKYYRDLGYECGKNTEIEVKVEDLPKGSRVCLNVACDYCNKKLIKSYDQYNKSLKNPIEKSTVNCYYNRKKYSQSAGLQGEENECIQIL